MKILENISVPTGNILVVEGDKGKLECLSIGDYGKEHNIKADFLGLRNEINGVEHCKITPLEEKWVITISSQYGCSMGCKFCDVPLVGPGINATSDDLFYQIKTAVLLHPEVTNTKRLNIHFARMGEPTWNENVLSVTRDVNNWLIVNKPKTHFHPVVSTVLPSKNINLWKFISEWIHLKNETMNGEAGLQLSIQSTCDAERSSMMSGDTHELLTIALEMERLIGQHGLIGRKIALNFAIDDESIISGRALKDLFDPKYFMCKITPMHASRQAVKNGFVTTGGYEAFYPYKRIEDELKDSGFDVIVFVPSKDEDESKITCGNAILSEMDKI